MFKGKSIYIPIGERKEMNICYMEDCGEDCICRYRKVEDMNARRKRGKLFRGREEVNKGRRCEY